MLVLRMVEERFHRDAEGRPIRESRTPPELLKAGEIELKACPYGGSRHQHPNPMNVSALRQTSAHWDEVIDAVAVLRAAYTEARGSYRADLNDIWRVGQMGSALPWFYILHRGETCPAYAAALSKATLGVGIWGARMQVQHVIDRGGPDRYTAQMILDTSEETGTLIADHEVCAASDKMMLKFYAPFVDADAPFTGLGAVGPIAAARGELARFAAHYIALKQWMWLYWLARRFLLEDIVAVTARTPELADLLGLEGEPPDFFLVQPERVSEMPLAHRAHWFRGLAALVEPFAPDASDAAYRTYADRIAEIMGSEPATAALTAEVAAGGHAAEASQIIARAIAMYAELDATFADVIATVEAGFHGDAGAVIDAGVRDRVLPSPPRAVFARFAPVGLAAITRP
ncbi:MAG: hypothetical protein ABI867_17015 [Kofleriaceae bacterium]